MKNALIFDFDGVLVDSAIHMMNKVNLRFNTNFTFNDWTHFEMLHETTVTLSKNTMAEVCEWLNHTDVVCKGKPYVGAQTMVTKVFRMGITPVIATARTNDQREETLRQVAKYFPEIEPVHVCLCPAGMPSAKFKESMLRYYEALGIVEDSGGTLMKIHERRLLPKRKNFLRDQPWNQHYDLLVTPEILRVGNWKKDDAGWDTILQNLNE